MKRVVCIPGVGLGGWAFDAFRERVDARVVERSGGEVTEQADAIARDIAAHEGVAFVVGVSGGATVGLSLVQRHPDVVAHALLHEPLVGPAVPALHEVITRRAAAMTDPVEFLVGLVGARTWARLPADRRDGVDLARVRGEVGAFARFAVAEPLDAHTVTTTVGADSGPERHAVAAWLAARGAQVVALAGCANAAHLDAPAALAAIVKSKISVS